MEHVYCLAVLGPQYFILDGATMSLRPRVVCAYGTQTMGTHSILEKVAHFKLLVVAELAPRIPGMFSCVAIDEDRIAPKSRYATPSWSRDRPVGT